MSCACARSAAYSRFALLPMHCKALDDQKAIRIKTREWETTDWILTKNAQLVDLKWTEEAQTKLKTLVETCTFNSASAAWRVHRWRLACFSLVLGDSNDRNSVFLSGPASILKACAKGGPARPGSEAAWPARDLKSLHRPA